MGDAVRRVLQLVAVVPEMMRQPFPDFVAGVAGGNDVAASPDDVKQVRQWFEDQMEPIRRVVPYVTVALFDHHRNNRAWDI